MKLKVLTWDKVTGARETLIHEADSLREAREDIETANVQVLSIVAAEPKDKPVAQRKVTPRPINSLKMKFRELALDLQEEWEAEAAMVGVNGEGI